jgi:hypothetical protein
MAQLVFKVGSMGRTLLGRLLGPLYCHVRPTPVLPWHTTAAGCRGVFLDQGYSTLLASCLPRPPMVELNDQDYMVPLRAFVTFVAAFATPHDMFQRYSVLAGTHAIAALRPQVGLTALVALWMDDFDANTALSKLNRTSVFATVATVLLVDATGSLVATYSNIVAACNKHGNHKGILRGFGGQHYCGALGHCVPLRVALLHAVCDQPGKRGLFGLRAGNGKYHACFGYSINYATLQKPFPDCAEYRGILFDSDDAPPTCPHCHAWTLPTHEHHMPYAMPLIPELQTALPALHALNQGGGLLTMDILLATWDECWAKRRRSARPLPEPSRRGVAQLQYVGPSPGGAGGRTDCRGDLHRVSSTGPAPLCATHDTHGLELYATTPVARGPDAPTDGDHPDRGGYGLRMGGRPWARGHAGPVPAGRQASTAFVGLAGWISAGWSTISSPWPGGSPTTARPCVCCCPGRTSVWPRTCLRTYLRTGHMCNP